MTCTALIDSWIGDRLEQQRREAIQQEGEAVHE
jgi:hypothetical protein